MIQEISKRVKAVFTEDGFTASNSILVEDDIKLMIDSGAGRIMSQVDTGGIDILFNSHRHLDHVSGNDLMVNAKILAHPLERAAMQDPAKMAALGGWKELMELDINEESKKMESDPKMGAIPDMLFKPWRIDGEINEGQVIDCGSTRITVLLTPGHTSGHCSFLFPDENLIFMADICLTAVGPWYGEEQSDIDDFVKSINRVISLKPDKLITGHRIQVIDKNIADILSEYRNRIFKREKRIFNFIQGKPASINEIAEKRFIYREHPIIFVLFWEKYMVKKHLEHLIKLGSAEKLNDGRFLAK